MLTWFAVNALVAVVLAAALYAVCRCVRFRPAVEHALWLIVLLRLLTPPGLAWPWSPANVWPSRWPGEIDVSSTREPPDIVLTAATTPGVSHEMPRTPRPDMPRQPETTGPSNDSRHSSEDDLSLQLSMPQNLPDSRAVTPAPALSTEASREVSTPTSPALSTLSNSTGLTSSPSITGGRPKMDWTLLLLSVWAAGAVTTGLLQVRQARRYGKLLRTATRSNSWLEREVALLAERMGVRPPQVWTVSRIGSPLIACGPRLKLLWPRGLDERLEPAAVRNVIAHELAHLRRRDHWVVRLELAAAWLWWWNPLFWYVRRKLHELAEQACDAWVVWAFPDARRRYAESLIEVTRQMSPPADPAWALGVGGRAGKSFERRLVMIVRDNVPRRVPRRGAALLCLLALAVLPGWLPAQVAEGEPEANATEAPADANRQLQAEESSNDSSFGPQSEQADPRPEPSQSDFGAVEPSADESAADELPAVEPPLGEVEAGPAAVPGDPETFDSVQQAVPAAATPSGPQKLPNSAASTIRIFRIKHPSPSWVAVTIAAIFGGEETHSDRGGRTNRRMLGVGLADGNVVDTADSQAGALGNLGQARAASEAAPDRVLIRFLPKPNVKPVSLTLKGGLRLLVDDPTRSLIVRGLPQEIDTVAELVTIFDQPDGRPATAAAKFNNGRILTYRSRTADEMAMILEGLGFQIENRPQRLDSEPVPSGGLLPLELVEYDAKRSAGNPGGVLLADGPEQELEQLAELIRHLDGGLPQPVPTGTFEGHPDSGDDAYLPPFGTPNADPDYTEPVPVPDPISKPVPPGFSKPVPPGNRVLPSPRSSGS